MIDTAPATELRFSKPMETQRATFTPQGATIPATEAQPDSLKAAALRVLGRNYSRNHAQLGPQPSATTGATLPSNDEATICAWLTHIGETDKEIITDVLDCYRDNKETRKYFLARASELSRVNVQETDDLHPCIECTKLARSGLCLSHHWETEDHNSRFKPVPTLPRRCRGFFPKNRTHAPTMETTR